MFGELIPSGDPQWYQGFRSPHYKQTHYDFRDMWKNLETVVNVWGNVACVLRRQFELVDHPYKTSVAHGARVLNANRAMRSA